MSYAVTYRQCGCGLQDARTTAAGIADSLLAEEAKEHAAKQKAQKRKAARCVS